MGRPRTLNQSLQHFSAETVRRMLRRQRTDPDWVPDAEQAKMLKTLAETQRILQGAKPVEADFEDLPPEKRKDMLAGLEDNVPEAPASGDDEG